MTGTDPRGSAMPGGGDWVADPDPIVARLREADEMARLRLMNDCLKRDLDDAKADAGKAWHALDQAVGALERIAAERDRARDELAEVRRELHDSRIETHAVRQVLREFIGEARELVGVPPVQIRATSVAWQALCRIAADDQGATDGAVRSPEGRTDGAGTSGGSGDVEGAEGRVAVHSPYNDDGALYCGWTGDGGTFGGCGEAWPCSTVRETAEWPTA